MNRLSSAISALLMVTVSSLMLPGVAGAQGSSNNEAKARADFDEARTLRDKGSFEAACALFKEAHGLFPTGGTALSFADCEEKAGHLEEARALYQFILADPASQSNSQRTDIARQHTQSIDAELAARAAQQQQPTAPPVAETKPPSKPLPAAPPPSPERHINPVPGAVLLGAGGAVLIVGGVLGGVAKSQLDGVKKHCTNDVCPTAQKPAADSAKTKAIGADVSFGVGAALAAAGVVLLFTIKSQKTAPAAALRFEPTSDGFLWHF